MVIILGLRFRLDTAVVELDSSPVQGDHYANVHVDEGRKSNKHLHEYSANPTRSPSKSNTV
jgi:hypothetical protein